MGDRFKSHIGSVEVVRDNVIMGYLMQFPEQGHRKITILPRDKAILTPILVRDHVIRGYLMQFIGQGHKNRKFLPGDRAIFIPILVRDNVVMVYSMQFPAQGHRKNNISTWGQGNFYSNPGYRQCD